MSLLLAEGLARSCLPARTASDYLECDSDQLRTMIRTAYYFLIRNNRPFSIVDASDND